MAHQDIRRLTNELDAAKMNNLEPSGVLQRFIQEIALSESVTIFSSLTVKLLIGMQSHTRVMICSYLREHLTQREDSFTSEWFLWLMWGRKT